MKTVATQLSRVLPAGLAMLFLVLGNVYGQASAPPAAAPAPPDFSKVEIKTTKISNNFYTLEGQGGTIGVLAGPEGILMVDDQFAPLSQKIVAAVRQISNSPIRFLVNTHVHPDHTGGNENFGKMGVTIISRDELRARLAHPVPAANGTPGVPAAAIALPMVTYEGRMTFHMDGEDAELIPIPRAHTDGDTMIFFHNADVIMTGDFFRSVGYPNIDRANGGSLNGMLAGLGVTIGMMGPNTKAIPGHGPVTNRAGITAHRDMILAIRDRVAQLVQQGKSAQEVLAAHPTAEYDARVPMAKETSDRFVGQLYAELTAAK
jgi:glyoxylase-like metal-dependent hydrolase (beta-lactamase superfamily II)